MTEPDMANRRFRGYLEPPCQRPDCERASHFRTGYVYCLTHDHVDVPPQIADPEPSGIATDDFRFFFGASCGSSRKTLRQLEEPNVMLSYATKDNHPWDSIQSLMVDSGGYSLLSTGETAYPDSVDDYLDYVDESGADYFVCRDVPAAEAVLSNLERGASEAIARTVELTADTLEAYSDREIDAEPMAVLQGTTPKEYVSCYHELVAADALTSRLAIGSLKEHTTDETVDIITTVRETIDEDTAYSDDDLELHGLGVEVPALEYEPVKEALASADSSRYIRTARWRAAHDEQPPRLRSDEPRSGWYEVMRDYLDMRSDLRDVLDAEGLSDPTPGRQGGLGDFTDGGTA